MNREYVDEMFPGLLVPSTQQENRLKVYPRQCVIRIDGITCTCGALLQYRSSLYYLHDDHCIINQKYNGG